MLRAMIAACGHSVALAGNNDTPFSAAVLIEPAPSYIVLEVSSYQLETVSNFHPWIAAALNLTPDHLGRHKTMAGYAAAKNRIFAQQGPGDAAVLNADDAWVSSMTTPAGVQRLAFSTAAPTETGACVRGDTICMRDQPLAALADNPLPGRHNLANVLAALTIMRAGGFDCDKTVEGLRTFRGVEHRLEAVEDIDGVHFYNDSKSTNVDSLRVALESFDRPIVLIAGGRGKGSAYEPLSQCLQQHVKQLVTLGEDASLLEAAFGPLVQTQRAADMPDAVRRAQRAAVPGDVVLLSPGCASFDMYRNFEERGHDYKRWVRRLAERQRQPS